MIDFIYQHKKGLFGTTIFHAFIIVGIIAMKLFAPYPPPDEDGIMINFGTDTEGVGMEEPIRQEMTTPIAQESTIDQEEEEVIPPVNIPEEVIPDPNTDEAEEVLTQEIEEAPEIKAAREKEELEKERKRQEELEKQQKEEKERKEREEAERLRLAEIERQRQLEVERLAKIERERKAKEEAERKRVEEETRTKKEISDRVKGSFSNIGEGKVNNKVSEGSLYKPGNQGSVSGTDKTNKHADGESSGTKGVSFSLEGRNPIGKLKKPTFPGNESGKVVVLIVVDKNGKVISATPGHRGTTIMKKNLFDAAQKAAFTARFDKARDPNSPNQQGTITYDFTLY